MNFNSQEETKELYRQIELGRKLLVIERKMLDMAQIDSKYTPTDERLAQELGITIEQVKELREFAHNELGEVERDMIWSGVGTFMDGKGKTIGKGGYEDEQEEF